MGTQSSSKKRRSLEVLSVSGVLLGAIAALLAAILGQNGIYGFLSDDSESENDPGSVNITNTNTNENSATGGNANSGNVNSSDTTDSSSEGAPPTIDPNPFPPSGSSSTPEMTRAEYDQIQMGMTYQDVAAIVGSPGNRSSANGPFVTYEWDDGGPFGVSVTFSRDRVTMIGSYGHGADLFTN